MTDYVQNDPAPQSPMHATGVSTNRFHRPASWAQNLIIVLLCQACEVSMLGDGPILEGGDGRTVDFTGPQGYCVGMVCPKCQRRVDVMIGNPGVPSGLIIPNGRG